MDRWEKENIYRYLNQIIDRELDKPEPDMELVDECNALLDDMEQEIYNPKPDIKVRRLQKLYSEYRKMHTWGKAIQFKWRWSKLATAACIIIMLVGVPVTVAAVNGISPINLIEQLGKKILSWNIGEVIEFEGISLIRNGETTKYGSIEDCIKQENLDIYYTSWLPDGVSIESAIILTTGDHEELIVKYSDENVTFICKKGTSGSYTNDKNITDSLYINDFVVYYRVLGNKYLAEIVLEDKVYAISANSYEDMVNILNGLKKWYK